MELTYFPSGKVDWEKIIRDYATEMDMTFADSMKFLAKRPSLRVAAEVMGLTGVKKDQLNELGAFLDSRSYNVPKLDGDLTNVERGMPGMSEATRVRKEREHRRPVPTKEEYLDLRIQGLTKTAAFGKLKIGPVKGAELLKSWDINDRLAERDAVNEWKLRRETVKPANATNASSALSASAGAVVDNSLPIANESAGSTKTQEKSSELERCFMQESEPKNASSSQDDPQVAGNSEAREESDEEYITIRLPLRVVAWPNTFPETIQRIDRDQLIELGTRCLQNAAMWAYKELRDILGDGADSAQVQGFMTRKIGG